jgi:antitoxin (DNA-binding transcriptional repressor) of toxin-antitoxin stability system
MKRILLIFYSQSGEAARAATIFETEMAGYGHSVTAVRLHPQEDYPYPWGSVGRFFDVMPETQLGLPPPIRRPMFDTEAPWDLVVLISPVWFLSPALPVQGFFRTPQAAVLRDRPVLSVTVSRAMWQQGSEGLKRLLAAAGARHVDNVVVTHQGSPVATLVSTPRALLSGKRGRLFGIFPEPGVAADDQDRLTHLARVAAARLAETDGPVAGPLLSGEPAVTVRRWLIGPELAGWYAFHGWARLIRALGRTGNTARMAGVWGFALYLVLMILVGLPVTLIATLILYVFARGWLERRAARLAAPTGEAPAIRR